MSQLLELPRLPIHVLMPTVHQLKVSGSTGNDPGGIGWTLADCNTCGGKGTFRTWLQIPGDTDHIGEFRCPCREQLRLRRWFSVHGLAQKYQQYTLGQALGWDQHDPRRKFLGEQIVRIESGKVPLSSVLYSYSGGTGKTLMAVLTTKALLKQGVDAYYLRSSSLSSVVTNWGGEEGREIRKWWTKRVRSCEVLIIDDLGRELSGAWEVARLSDLIQHRHSLGLPWVISTNIDPRGDGLFRKIYGEETQSTIVGDSEIVDLNSAPEFDYGRVHAIEEELGIDRPAVFLGIGG